MTDLEQRLEGQIQDEIQDFGRITTRTKELARQLIAERWPPEKRPQGFPEFDIAVSDGCSGGVRQVAQLCCVLHDSDYWYGTTLAHKLAADARLGVCISREGWRRVRDPEDPTPYLSLPGWWLMSVMRSVGVVFGGNRAFFGKPHKRWAKS